MAALVATGVARSGESRVLGVEFVLGLDLVRMTSRTDWHPRFLLAFCPRFLGSAAGRFHGRSGRFSTALLGRPNGPWTGRESFTTAAKPVCEADAVTGI